MIRPGFWLRLSAIAIGVYVALWWIGGDRNPDASDSLIASCVISQDETFDFHNVQFFSLKCAEGQATLSIDGDLVLAKYLRSQRGQKVDIEIRPRELQRIER